MKRIFGLFRRKLDDVGFQQRAARKIEDIEKGEKVLPPRHPADEKAFQKALSDDSLKQKVNAKYDDLVENMSKITVKSSDPPLKPKTNRPLPSRSDDLMLDQNMMLYGFHEPPLERMDEDKLMFREALEILRTRLELEDDQFTLGDDEQNNLRRINSHKFLENHPAVKRVDKQKLDTVFEYFRPFVRKEEQRVIRKADAEKLQSLLDGKMGDLDDIKAKLPFYRRKLEQGAQKETFEGKKNLATLDKAEQREMLEIEKTKHLEDARRLDKALSDIHQEISSQAPGVKPVVGNPDKSTDIQFKKDHRDK